MADEMEPEQPQRGAGTVDLVQLVVDFFHSNELIYQQPREDAFLVTFGGLEASIRTIVQVDAAARQVMVVSSLPFRAALPCRGDAVALANRLNHRLKRGGFVVAGDDGQVYFRDALDASALEPSLESVKSLIFSAVGMMDSQAHAFGRVIFGEEAAPGAGEGEAGQGSGGPPAGRLARLFKALAFWRRRPAA